MKRNVFNKSATVQGNSIRKQESYNLHILSQYNVNEHKTRLILHLKVSFSISSLYLSPTWTNSNHVHSLRKWHIEYTARGAQLAFGLPLSTPWMLSPGRPCPLARRVSFSTINSQKWIYIANASMLRVCAAVYVCVNEEKRKNKA